MDSNIVTIDKIKGSDAEAREHGEVLFGREIRQTRDVYTWASDPKHAPNLMDELGLQEAKCSRRLGPEERTEMDATKQGRSDDVQQG